MELKDFSAVNTSIEEGHYINGYDAIKVVKTGKMNEYDTDSYAVLSGLELHNGTIEVDMLSRLAPDAPDFARGFIGLAFRIDSAGFECFYIRPTNSIKTCDDPVRRSHGCQYFSYPGYTFEFFRKKGIAKYEREIDCGLDEWVHLKIDVEGETASFSLNNDRPILTVDKLFGGDKSGGIGLFVDIGTEGYFKDLVIDKR